MSHEVETMAYAHEVPWHGLGANVDAKSSVEEMLVAAGLDWRLEPHKMLIDMGDGKTTPAPNRIAWVRDKDRKPMVISSPNWRPLQPAQTIGFMRDYVEAGAATLETAGSLRGGKVVWGLARINHDFEVGRGDRVRGFLLITSPNELGRAITVRTTTVRVVCANTLAMAESGGHVQYTQSHMGEFDVDAAKEHVGRAHEQLAQAERNARTIAALKLSVDDALRKVILPTFAPEIAEDEELMADAMASSAGLPKKIQQILDAMESGPGQKEVAGTGWGVLNGVTYWADHVYGRDASTRLYRSWMGDNSKLKLETEKRLLELAA